MLIYGCVFGFPDGHVLQKCYEGVFTKSSTRYFWFTFGRDISPVFGLIRVQKYYRDHRTRTFGPCPPSSDENYFFDSFLGQIKFVRVLIAITFITQIFHGICYEVFRLYRLHKIYYKVSIFFICTDSFWPLTCKKIQIGAHASAHLKSIGSLYYNIQYILKLYTLYNIHKLIF